MKMIIPIQITAEQAFSMIDEIMQVELDEEYTISLQRNAGKLASVFLADQPADRQLAEESEGKICVARKK